MSRILLCHRGCDSRDVAERVGDRLRARFGARRVVVLDESDPAARHRATERWQTIVLVLGDDAGFEDPGSSTRLALESALRGNAMVIPVLIDGGGMPAVDTLPTILRPLAYQNGLPLRLGLQFEHDIARLIEGLQRPVTLADSPSLTRWLTTVLARSRGRMAVYTSLSLGATIPLLTFPTAAREALSAEGVMGLLVAIPVVLGLIAGGRHGILGGLLGLFAGLFLPALQMFGLAILGVFISGMINLSQGTRFVSETTDHGIILALPAGCLALTGLLMGSALVAHRHVPAGDGDRRREVRGRTTMILCCGIGLVLGIALGEVAFQTRAGPATLLAMIGPTALLIGIQLGVLDAAMTD